MIESVKRFHKEYGRIPKCEEFAVRNGYPSRGTVTKYFGTWNNLLIEAGFNVNRMTNPTKERLLDSLKKFEKKEGRPPTKEDFLNNPEYPSFMIIIGRFGSFENAKKLIGQDIDSLVRKGLIDSKHRKGRLAEIFVMEHFADEGAIDLAGKNCNSSYDGICPKKQKFDVKGSAFRNRIKNGSWNFNLDKVVDYYYLLAFNEDYSELEHAWRIPTQDFADIQHLQITIKRLEKMRKYEITDKFSLSFDNWLKNRE